ncbi:MAG: RNA polymerase alpha subunit C-terminal domain-containing protein [Paenibacillus sp.]|uniref:RNA polymerase alpha subunit C-terminal domain-containing protein n=1 Tax=Paenibacillus sp. TaxID=58172 RepID=UPI002904670C|nr:RNA polymerase alpha subunit C-terminal domain-containing protein [Paenibacillus sp.]MDU2241321.1 RNA polymerase alpha subunit C-terminal domain-containing protein [Paenibacillus sp.]
MTERAKTLRTCPKGHTYYKSSDCPTCPACEQERKPEAGFLLRLSAPARRALEANGVTTLEKLAGLSEQEVLQFHGMGPSSLPKLREALHAKGFRFKS